MSPRRIPLLDLPAQHRHIREEILAEVTRVIDSQKFILGEEVQQFEREIAAYCQVPFAIGCASGSDDLVLALMATGIRPGDEVLTIPYTFFATVSAITRLGAVPVFVDISADTFNIDTTLVAGVLDAHPKIRAMIPVHLFGASADMDPLLDLARDRGLTVIEDAAQSIGAEYKGRRCGSLGQIGCFSFFPTKNLGAWGDGGLLTTSDFELAGRLAALRVHGSRQEYVHEWVGLNSRLDALQAAVLRVKLRHLDAWTEARRRNASLYYDLLGGLAPCVTAPRPQPYSTRHIYNQFVVRCQQRDRLRSHLTDSGIGTAIYYPIPLHRQQCFADLGYRQGDFPASEALAAESLALPIHSELSAADIEYICEAIRSFYS